MTFFRSLLLLLLGASLGIFLILNFSFLITGHTDYTARLYYSLPGAAVGLLALVWNIFNQAKISALSAANEQKEYALSSFDKYAAEPVRQAIEAIDDLMKEIETALHDEASGQKDLKAKIENILENKVMLYINKAYRLCREADAYMREQKLSSDFERNMYFISDDQKLDDLIIINLDDARQNGQLKIVLSQKMATVERAITNKKAFIRSQLVIASKDIAHLYDKRTK